MPSYEADGFLRISGACREGELSAIDGEAAGIHGAGSRIQRFGPATLAMAARMLGLLRERRLAGDGWALAWITLFDKRPERNWAVPLHRDEFVPLLDAQHPIDGISERCEKEGQAYGKAAAHILRSIIAVRLSLDPAGADSGALLVVPGSHAGASTRPQELVETERGDLLVMSPLLEHASRKVQGGRRRRVIHCSFVAPAWVGVIGSAIMAQARHGGADAPTAGDSAPPCRAG